MARTVINSKAGGEFVILESGEDLLAFKELEFDLKKAYCIYPAYSLTDLALWREFICKFQVIQSLDNNPGTTKPQARYVVWGRERRNIEEIITILEGNPGSSKGITENLRAFLNFINNRVMSKETESNWSRYWDVVQFFTIPEKAGTVVINTKEVTHTLHRQAMEKDFPLLLDRLFAMYPNSDTRLDRIEQHLNEFMEIIEKEFPGTKRGHKNFSDYEGLIISFRKYTQTIPKDNTYNHSDSVSRVLQSRLTDWGKAVTIFSLVGHNWLNKPKAFSYNGKQKHKIRRYYVKVCNWEESGFKKGALNLGNAAIPVLRHKENILSLLTGSHEAIQAAKTVLSHIEAQRNKVV